GGMLLNLMPCVFPVLSIKVLGFVQQAGEDRSKVKLHGLVFLSGVLVSFWVLAGIFLALRAAGQEIGWGFQLQTPGFVAVLASILFLFGLNLSGVFEIGESLVGAGQGLQAKSGYSGSFFSGVLATVVATPCTAPFMGTALGVIITMSAIQSMTVFTALALGVALPYVLLSIFPTFLKWLPRPGAWMESFKKALAFLLYATVVWLAWVFGNQVGVNGMAALLLGLVALGIAAWIWGNWGNLTRKKSVRRVAALATLIFLVTGGVIQFVASGFEAVGLQVESEDKAGISWKPYSPDSVATYLEEGKTVYVDFTAKWCLTCQVNKRVALSNEEVIRYFKDQDIVALQGDWTRRDPVITRELEKFGRSGVPTNIIYRTNGSTQLLPEVLTPSIVLEALRKRES
ncbi:MAG: thioredoxin family protein, partial [Verrucomicrobiae bacterium]|nr:thioredoxin family protein [Verrucomicrobiae bacterium]